MVDSTDTGADDPRSLSLDDLRALRNRLQEEDDVTSYVRRVAQARIDLVRAEQHRRDRDDAGDNLSDELRVVLASQLTGGSPRPPRPIENLDDDRLIIELDSLCADHGFSRLEELLPSELVTLEQTLIEFERRISDERRARFDRLDALSAELVRRYREGEASVDGLLGS